jgi:hypothetical protein
MYAIFFYTFLSISVNSVHWYIMTSARCLPVQVILATSTVVTRGRKDNKCGLFVLKFYSKLNAFISAGTSNSMQENASSEIKICLALKT